MAARGSYQRRMAPKKMQLNLQIHKGGARYNLYIGKEEYKSEREVTLVSPHSNRSWHGIIPKKAFDQVTGSVAKISANKYGEPGSKWLEYFTEITGEAS